MFSFWSTPVYDKHAGGRHIRTSGLEIATLFTMDKWLDNYKVMTSMNIVKLQAVYKSTIVLINSIFQKGMRAVDQKLKINLVWPYTGVLCTTYCLDSVYYVWDSTKCYWCYMKCYWWYMPNILTCTVFVWDDVITRVYSQRVLHMSVLR